jgi:hypothetical protein
LIPTVTNWLVEAARGAGSSMDGRGHGVSVVSCLCGRIGGSTV